MTNTAPIIRNEQEHQEARAEHRAALEAYEKVPPIRTDEDYAAAHNAYTTLQEYGRADGDHPRRIAALLRQYEYALTTYDAMNGRR